MRAPFPTAGATVRERRRSERCSDLSWLYFAYRDSDTEFVEDLGGFRGSRKGKEFRDLMVALALDEDEPCTVRGWKVPKGGFSVGEHQGQWSPEPDVVIHIHKEPRSL